MWHVQALCLCERMHLCAWLPDTFPLHHHALFSSESVLHHCREKGRNEDLQILHVYATLQSTQNTVNTMKHISPLADVNDGHTVAAHHCNILYIRSSHTTKLESNKAKISLLLCSHFTKNSKQHFHCCPHPNLTTPQATRTSPPFFPVFMAPPSYTRSPSFTLPLVPFVRAGFLLNLCSGRRGFSFRPACIGVRKLVGTLEFMVGCPRKEVLRRDFKTFIQPYYSRISATSPPHLPTIKYEDRGPLCCE